MSGGLDILSKVLSYAVPFQELFYKLIKYTFLIIIWLYAVNRQI